MKLIPLSEKKCLECGDEHEEWDEDWQEPYFILGVCFFCRVEIENERKNNINMENKNNGWIINSKPEENKDVLIFCEHIQPNVQHAFWDGKNWRQHMFDFETKIYSKSKVLNVIGWQNFPDPPKI